MLSTPTIMTKKGITFLDRDETIRTMSLSVKDRQTQLTRVPKPI